MRRSQLISRKFEIAKYMVLSVSRARLQFVTHVMFIFVTKIKWDTILLHNLRYFQTKQNSKWKFHNFFKFLTRRWKIKSDVYFYYFNTFDFQRPVGDKIVELVNSRSGGWSKWRPWAVKWIFLTLRRPTCQSWHIKVFFSSHGSASTAMSKRWKNVSFI